MTVPRVRARALAAVFAGFVVAGSPLAVACNDSAEPADNQQVEQDDGGQGGQGGEEGGEEGGQGEDGGQGGEEGGAGGGDEG